MILGSGVQLTFPILKDNSYLQFPSSYVSFSLLSMTAKLLEEGRTVPGTWTPYFTDSKMPFLSFYFNVSEIQTQFMTELLLVSSKHL